MTLLTRDWRPEGIEWSGTRPLHVGVVGATGNVGTMMLRVLAERGVPVASLRAFASPSSAGRPLEWSGGQAVVEDLSTADPTGLDVALFSAGAARAVDHAPRFAEAGVVVIDNSSAFRMDPDVPLVVPEVNAAAALEHRGIIANPNCSTIQLVAVVQPIRAAAGLDAVRVVTMQSVSGTGLAAIEELLEQSRRHLEADEQLAPSVYPHPIAFNVIPHCDSFDDDGNTKEELKLVNESRRIMDAPDLRVSATCTRVPVLVGHSEAVHIVTSRPMSPDECRAALEAAPGVEVIDDPATAAYPLARSAAGHDAVQVGRIRRDPVHDRGLALFIAADNLRKGAATNAVQILEVLAAAGRWPAH